MTAPKNLLMIVCDQFRYDSLGFSGSNAVAGAPIRTPNLDALAGESRWFDRAYTALPSCCPARQSMLTGKRPEAFGALWNYNITSKVSAITPDVPTFTARMHEAGFRMGHVGSWDESPDHTPLDFGYDEMYTNGDYYRFRAANYPDKKTEFDWFGCVDPIPLEASHTHTLARVTSDMISRFEKGGAPWCVRVDFSEPHLPCNPCREFAELYRQKDLSPWPSFSETFEGKPYIQKQMLYSWANENKTWEDWSRFVANYFAMIAQTDDAVGKIISALKSSDAYEDTVILFTADHGDMCGSHRMIDKHYTLYEDTVHVPFFVRLPGAKPGRINGFINSCLDLAPTLQELFGFAPFETHGISLVPALRGEDAPLRDYAVSSTNGQQFGLYSQRMIRTERYKYIWNLTDTDELYDMENDSWELQNLIREPSLAQTLADLRRRLFEVLSREDPDIVKTEWPRRQLLEGRKL